jgi:hypothetical protein
MLTLPLSAFGGYLKVLAWLRNRGYKWNANICTYAAEGGHLEVLLRDALSGAKVV